MTLSMMLDTPLSVLLEERLHSTCYYSENLSRMVHGCNDNYIIFSSVLSRCAQINQI